MANFCVKTKMILFLSVKPKEKKMYNKRKKGLLSHCHYSQASVRSKVKKHLKCVKMKKNEVDKKWRFGFVSTSKWVKWVKPSTKFRENKRLVSGTAFFILREKTV